MGMEQLGIESDFIPYRTLISSRYEAPRGLPFAVRLATELNRRSASLANRLGVKARRVKLAMRLPGESVLFLWSLTAIRKYDVFIFGFGASLWPWNLDLPILRKLGKTVISNMSLGSETRPPFINGALFDDNGGVEPSMRNLRSSSKAKSKRLAWHQKWADFLIGSPLSTSQFATSDFINSFYIGTPIGRHEAFSPTEPGVGSADRLRILHAPSRRKAKGTEEIIRIVAELKDEGVQLELVVKEQVSNSEVLMEIAASDVILDQMYSDIPWPVFACEAALFGKPAVFGSYAKLQMKRWSDEEMWPPFEIVHPGEIKATLRALADDPERRNERGNEGKRFVNSALSPKTVASKYLRLIHDNIPEDWVVSPGSVSYFNGIGLEESEAKQLVKRYIERYGVMGTYLKHPKHLSKLTQFAQDVL